MSSGQKERALRVSKRLGAVLAENAAKAGVHVVVTPRQPPEAALTEQARKIIADLRDSKRVVDKDVLAWLMGGSPGLKLALHSRKLDLRAYTRSRRNVSRRMVEIGMTGSLGVSADVASGRVRLFETIVRLVKPRPPAHEDITWIAVGDRVVFHPDKPAGERSLGIFRDDPAQKRDDGFLIGHDRKANAWLIHGALGVVIAPPQYGSARHRCPNHHLGPDECICANEADEEPGWIPERPTSALVAWEMDDGGAPYERLIRRDGEGTNWGLSLIHI